METIAIEDAIKSKHTCFIDVRSPKEYKEDHIPGAINIPILDDEERAIIGTIYKHNGKDMAVDKGLEYVTPKLKDLYNDLKKHSDGSDEVVIYCFRGGMRSGSVVDFASGCGLKVKKLEGGYKSYRRFVIEYLKNLEKKFQFVILHGHTGIGKTQMLLELEKEGVSILDLEFFAKNSGSVFGDIYYTGERPSQKYFETVLFDKIWEYEQNGQGIIFMESESKKIGRCVLTQEFWDMMQNGKHILVEASLEGRVRRCVDDYTEKTKDNDQQLINSIKKLKDRLGNEKINELIQQASEKKYDEIASFLMVEYYDKLYLHSQKMYSYELVVNSDKMTQSVQEIVNWYKNEKSNNEKTIIINN